MDKFCIHELLLQSASGKINYKNAWLVENFSAIKIIVICNFLQFRCRHVFFCDSYFGTRSMLSHMAVRACSFIFELYFTAHCAVRER